MDVPSLCSMLDEVKVLCYQDNIDLWSIRSFEGRLSTSSFRTFTAIFRIFACLLGFEDYRHVRLRDIIFDTPETLKLQRRFLFILFLIIFFRSQKCYQALQPVFFLLHYRGLSHTGFHLLNQMGLSPTPKTVSRSLQLFTSSLVVPLSENAVVWFDNIRRTLHGWVEENCQVDHTVLAQTFLSLQLPLLPTQIPDCIPETISRDLLLPIALMIRASNDINVLRPGSPLHNTDVLSNPLRVPGSPKFVFREIGVLPIRCGEFLGTLRVLDHLKSIGFWNYPSIRPLVVDYDLWWRIQRIILSESCVGGLETLRRKTLLIQGPWHLYKVLSEAFWKNFGHLFVYETFLASSTSNSPTASKTPDLKVITELMICMWSWEKTNGPFVGTCVHARLIRFALSDLIPLV